VTSPNTKPDYEKAAELAKAMRRGLDDLRSTPVALGTHSPSSGLTDLATYADLRSLPALAKTGRVTSRIVRAARSFLRALLRPWLAVQTEFNQGVMAELDDLRRRITAMENTSPGAMPVRQGRMRRHETAEDMPLQGQGHGTLDSSPTGAMPVALHRHETAEDMPLQSQGHGTLDSSPPGAMPGALRRHAAEEDQAFS
jgi:hypothetical protein